MTSFEKLVAVLERIAVALEQPQIVEPECSHPIERLEASGVMGNAVYVCGDCGEPVTSDEYLALVQRMTMTTTTHSPKVT